MVESFRKALVSITVSALCLLLAGCQTRRQTVGLSAMPKYGVSGVTSHRSAALFAQRLGKQYVEKKTGSIKIYIRLNIPDDVDRIVLPSGLRPTRLVSAKGTVNAYTRLLGTVIVLMGLADGPRDSLSFVYWTNSGRHQVSLDLFESVEGEDCFSSKVLNSAWRATYVSGKPFADGRSIALRYSECGDPILPGSIINLQPSSQTFLEYRFDGSGKCLGRVSDSEQRATHNPATEISRTRL